MFTYPNGGWEEGHDFKLEFTHGGMAFILYIQAKNLKKRMDGGTERWDIDFM